MSNKIIVLLIGVVIVLMLGLGGGLFMMWNKLATLNTQSVANAGEQPDQAASLEQPLAFNFRRLPPCITATFMLWHNSIFDIFFFIADR